MRPGVFTVYRWELQKLRFQKRTYLGLGAAALVPIIFAVAVATQNGQPEDVAFGRYIHETGLAIPLVLLLFGSIWMFPLITALVAGDIVAAEDHNGTLKTILTRSVERGQVFVGKALATATYAIAAIALTGTVAVVAGSLASGLHPLPTLSGTTISTGRALVLIGASLLVYLIPILSIAAIGLLFSTIFRNSAAAVVGTLMASLLLQLDRHPARARRAAALPAEHAVQRLAGAAAPAGGLGADRARRMGVLALRGPGLRGGACWSSCAATSPAAERDVRARSRGRRRRARAPHAHPQPDGRGLRGGGRVPTAAPRWRRSSAPRPTSWSSTDHARRRRAGGVPAPALQGHERLDPDAHRARRSRRPRARPRSRSRRLPGQAVRHGGAGRAAARPGAPRARRARPPRLRPTGARAQHAHRAARWAAGVAHRARGALLELLLRDAHVVVSRERAIEEIWHEAAVPNVVDRYVTRLRRKLGEPPLIHTVRGVGFMLRT